MIYNTTSDAYLAVLKTLLDKPQYRPSPRGQSTAEITNYLFQVSQPSDTPIVTMDEVRNQTIAKYLAIEKQLYMSGELSARVWSEKASKFWSKIANSNGTINSNYGHLLWKNQSIPDGRTPWEWVKDSLVDDNDSRQAFARISLPEHQRHNMLDQPCTMHLNFLIRRGQLDTCVVMRSNDAVRGLVYDMPWFCYCQIKMATELGVGIGIYSHFAHSMHLYDRDRITAKKMLGRPITNRGEKV